MARQVLPTIDLRSPDQRAGITSQQKTLEAIGGLLQTAGEIEKVRRESQQLDRVATAIANGASTIEAITAAANEPTEFSGGLQGLFQKVGGGFSQPGGGIEQQIQKAVIGQTLKNILTPQAIPSISQQRAAEAHRTGAVPGTAEFETIVGGPESAKAAKPAIFKPSVLKNIRETVEAGLENMKSTPKRGFGEFFTQDNLLEAYKSKAEEMGYSQLSKIQQKQFDAIWDRTARRKQNPGKGTLDQDLGGGEVKLGWNPNSPEVKQARKELKAGTQAEEQPQELDSATAEPQSQEEFLQNIQGIENEEEAKAYYDKWVGKWQ